MTHGARAANAGFTLLEILVAFTIATAALGLLFRIHANSTATVVSSQQYQEATALAQALIAESAVTERTLAFTRTGSTAEFEWTVRGSAYAGAIDDTSGQEPPYQLRDLAAEVRWAARDRDRRITVRSVKPFVEPVP
jgi:general secretion pathway protein I